jgi:hypothetical protein
MKRDYVLTDLTRAYWPGLPRYRGHASKRGYATREQAEARARELAQWAAAHYGARGSPDLRVVERARE